jgi:hypothetical protein
MVKVFSCAWDVLLGEFNEARGDEMKEKTKEKILAIVIAFFCATVSIKLFLLAIDFFNQKSLDGYLAGAPISLFVCLLSVWIFWMIYEVFFGAADCWETLPGEFGGSKMFIFPGFLRGEPSKYVEIEWNRKTGKVRKNLRMLGTGEFVESVAFKGVIVRNKEDVLKTLREAGRIPPAILK